MATWSRVLASLALLHVLAGALPAQHAFSSPGVRQMIDGSPAGSRLLRSDPGQAEPESDPLAPARFDLGERISAVTQGRVQIEAGYVFTLDRADGTKTWEHAVPDLLFRVGLTERLELRLGWPGYVATIREDAAGRSSSDRTLDPNVGFMLDLFPQQGWRPQTAILASVPITLEGNPFALESLQPLSQVLYCWYLTDRLSFGGTTGLSLFDDQGDQFIELQQSADVDYLLFDRLGAFVEWTVLVDHGSADDGAEHMLGGGLAVLCNDHFQVSWRAAIGLNQRAPDWLTGVRCALRF